jgi:hypothetical protein
MNSKPAAEGGGDGLFALLRGRQQGGRLGRPRYLVSITGIKVRQSQARDHRKTLFVLTITNAAIADVNPITSSRDK